MEAVLAGTDGQEAGNLAPVFWMLRPVLLALAIWKQMDRSARGRHEPTRENARIGGNGYQYVDEACGAGNRCLNGCVGGFPGRQDLSESPRVMHHWYGRTPRFADLCSQYPN